MTTNEKGIFNQIQNTIVSSKALVFVNCLNTFVHSEFQLMHAKNGYNGFHYYVKGIKVLWPVFLLSCFSNPSPYKEGYLKCYFNVIARMYPEDNFLHCLRIFLVKTLT